jgi:pimeloyl-ACP methyl ester carboxylesterase
MAKGLYRSEESKRLLFALYDRHQALLSRPLGECSVPTRFGQTHVLTLGNPAHPPLVVLHGGNSVNPFDLKPFETLADAHFIIAPDIIGQAGKSAETVLSPRTLDYGNWLKDCLGEMGITGAHFIGTSVGGGVLLNYAMVEPEKILKAAFLVPMGFGFSAKSMVDALGKLMLPYLAYRRTPSRANLLKAIMPLFINQAAVTPEWLELFEFCYTHLALSDGAFRKARKKGFAAFHRADHHRRLRQGHPGTGEKPGETGAVHGREPAGNIRVQFWRAYHVGGGQAGDGVHHRAVYGAYRQ